MSIKKSSEDIHFQIDLLLLERKYIEVQALLKKNINLKTEY